MEPTKLNYLNDSYQFEDTATLIGQQPYDDGRTNLILDSTIFYPQGGGQPYDTGGIRNEKGVFRVEEVRFSEGIVHHIGRFETGAFEVDQTIHLEIDEARRRQHCKLHSGGHLIDAAVHHLGHKLIPGKGYHFPDGPYVEYEGTIPEEEREVVRVAIENEVNRMIREGYDVKTQLANLEEMKTLCAFVPAYLPRDKPSRVVQVADAPYCPCGGTHVKNINEIQSYTIPKITSKKGVTRVRYEVA